MLSTLFFALFYDSGGQVFDIEFYFACHVASKQIVGCGWVSLHSKKLRQIKMLCDVLAALISTKNRCEPKHHYIFFISHYCLAIFSI